MGIDVSKLTFDDRIFHLCVKSAIQNNSKMKIYYHKIVKQDKET